MRFAPSRFFALVLALLLWGVSFPALKLALHGNHPHAVLFYRYSIAFLLILPWFLRRCRRVSLLQTFPGVLVLGVANWAGSLLQFAGLQHTTSTKSAILTQLMVVVVPILAVRMLGERLNASRIVAIFLSLTGAVVLSTNLEFPDFGRNATLLGDALTVAAVFFWAIFIIYTRRYAQKTDSFQLLWGNCLATTLLAALTAAATGETAIDSSGIGLSFFLAIFCTIFPTLLYNFALKEVDATTSVIVGPLETVSAVLVSFYVLGEELTLLGALGTVTILFSVYLVDRD